MIDADIKHTKDSGNPKEHNDKGYTFHRGGSNEIDDVYVDDNIDNHALQSCTPEQVNEILTRCCPLLVGYTVYLNLCMDVIYVWMLYMY